MIESKKINIIVAIVVALALIVSIVFVITGKRHETNGPTKTKTEAEYATKVFGPDLISLEIRADEEEWQAMLDSAVNEEYIKADVLVNGTKFSNVGIRPKGNSSLTQVANSDSDRYSFRLQFDEYIKGQKCFGLESFVVNNMLGDNTYMKEYVSYELMEEIGVDTPYFGYADIKVNGENWGLYLAVELYNESYEQRVYGDTSGMLYNVKSMDMGGNMGGNKGVIMGGNPPEQPRANAPAMPGGQNSSPPRPGDVSQQDFRSQQPPQDNRGRDGRAGDTDMERDFGGKGGPGSSGGSLEYTDDNTASYSAIFNNVVGKGTKKDFQRVITALKKLSQGEELEDYFDVDKILRYLAAHTIVVNLDSYSSGMAQNYYIYENSGKITILPWDYNLAWGGFQSMNASSVVNFPIDTPLSGVEMASRPLLAQLFSNPEYLERYHSYLQQLITEYFGEGKFEQKVKILDTLISNYVQNDQTAFCTYEEYKKAVPSFITLGNLRAQSVQGQLTGLVPSTNEAQKANASQLVATGDLNLADLGSMMGGGKGGFPGGIGGEVDREVMLKAMEIMQQTKGDITDEVRETLLSLGLTEEQFEQISAMAGEQFDGMGQKRNMPNRSDRPSPATPQRGFNNVILLSVLSFMLSAALFLAARFKKSY